MADDDDDKQRSGWYDPMGSRTKTIVIVVAGAIVAGAIITALVLGIPFF
ncbi:hypothetical protein ABIE21_001738 [Conyzicola nivalis]|uniref:Uncharacterized protein n=1 Tax=Conyzicola nivalis TaxID=1477021 RepID=A0ABV2QMW4_9MICO